MHRYKTRCEYFSCLSETPNPAPSALWYLGCTQHSSQLLLECVILESRPGSLAPSFSKLYFIFVENVQVLGLSSHLAITFQKSW